MKSGDLLASMVKRQIQTISSLRLAKSRLSAVARWTPTAVGVSTPHSSLYSRLYFLEPLGNGKRRFVSELQLMAVPHRRQNADDKQHAADERGQSAARRSASSVSAQLFRRNGEASHRFLHGGAVSASSLPATSAKNVIS